MLLTAVTFLVILTVLVLIHEFGHYAAARIIGVRVEEFGLGLPPRITGKKVGETEYTLNWLPIGGFVRLAGEDEAPGVRNVKADSRKAKRFFWARSKKERAAILSAGVIMNFLLAVAITVGLLATGVKEPSGRVHVERVVSGSPAQTAGLLTGDILLGMTGSEDPHAVYKIVVPKDIIAFADSHKGKTVTLRVLRGQDVVVIPLVPRINVPKGEGPIGIAISDLESHTYPFPEAFGKAVSINVFRARDMLASLGTTLWRLITLRPPESDVAGPIGIAQVTGQAVKFGWTAVLEFASILSLNLAVLNILPIPALDGGRLAFVLLEKIFRRRVNPIFERNAHQIGMIVLLALILLVSVNDILRLARGG